MAWNQIRHRARLVKDFGAVPPVHGNAAALGQVFLNMLVNAAQSIPEGDAERHEIKVSASLREDEVVIEIRDTGKGIPPDVLPHVFEPFFTTKPVGVGTGLGLSISRQTVTDHGGRIEIDSEPERGTAFRVILPAQGPWMPETSAPPRSRRRNPRPSAVDGFSSSMTKSPLGGSWSVACPGNTMSRWSTERPRRSPGLRPVSGSTWCCVTS